MSKPPRDVIHALTVFMTEHVGQASVPILQARHGPIGSGSGSSRPWPRPWGRPLRPLRPRPCASRGSRASARSGD